MSYILAVLLCVCAAASCSRSSKPIPRGQLSKLYAEMFLLDQRMGYQDSKIRIIADTTRVYEAILEKYGYTWENYLASQEEYIQDAERYSRILKKSAGIIAKEKGLLVAEKKRIEALMRSESDMLRFAPHRIYLLDSLSRCSLDFSFDFQEGLDTAYSGPRLIVWADTLAKPDTLAEQVEDAEIR